MNRPAWLVVAAACLLPADVGARADLSTELMNATFKLANDKSTATAFVLTDPARKQKILVTAAHVFEAMGGDEATLFLRRQEGEGLYKKQPLKLAVRKDGKALWTKHSSADVAAMLVEVPEGLGIPSLPLGLLASDETLKAARVGPGTSILCLGYPHRVEANDAGFPVLRSGPVASFPILPTAVTKTFLMSSNTFEGDSGGPVFLGDPRLIVGLMVGQHFVDEESRALYGSSKTRHRLGLGIVVHARFIRETIDLLPTR